jgi:hypothetical protein
VNTQNQSQKYGNLIAAGGTVIALIGFLFMPYVTMSSTASPQAAATPLVLSALQAASIQGFIWLEALLATGILLVALLLAFSHNPFGMSQVPLAQQIQRGAYTLIGVSVVSLLLQFVLMTTIPGQMIGMYSTNEPGFSSATSSFVSTTAMGYNVGSWFYLLGMLAVIGGAVYALGLIRTAPATQAQGVGQPASPYAQPAQNPQMPYAQPPQNPQMPWQQPVQQQPVAPGYQQQDWQQQPPVQPQQPNWQTPQDQYPPQQQWQPPYPPSSPGQ